MAVVHELLEEAEEVRDQQIADVQAVHVGVGGQDDLVVTQAFEVVFDVEAAHQIVHLVVFIDDVALEIPNVERLAFEHENGLRVHVAATHNRAGGRLAFRDEDHRLLALPFFLVQMNFAILELRDAEGDGLGAFARQLFDLLQFFAELLGVLQPSR